MNSHVSRQRFTAKEITVAVILAPLLLLVQLALSSSSNHCCSLPRLSAVNKRMHGKAMHKLGCLQLLPIGDRHARNGSRLEARLQACESRLL